MCLKDRKEVRVAGSGQHKVRMCVGEMTNSLICHGKEFGFLF